MNTEFTHDQNIVLSIGMRLRSAREELGLSQQTVAKRLCLKISIVRNIEEDKFPHDLALTFLRGYIRSYAKLVHIPEDEVLPMLQETNKIIKVIPIQNIDLEKYHEKRDVRLISFTCLLLFVLFGLTGAWWWENHKNQEEITSKNREYYNEVNKPNNNTQITSSNDCVSSNKKSQMPTIDKQLNNETNLSTFSKDQQSMHTPIQDQNDIIQSLQDNIYTKSKVPALTNNDKNLQSSLTSQTIITSPVNDQKILKINFTDDCWLEVIDSTGKRLFSGLQHKDNNLLFTGETPYKIKIGAPAAAQIQFLGKPIDLSYFMKTNQVAHLTLNEVNS